MLSNKMDSRATVEFNIYRSELHSDLRDWRKVSDLPLLKASKDGVVVAGYSSGGYMAGHMMVLYAERFTGALIASSFPFWTSKGNMLNVGKAIRDAGTVKLSKSIERAKHLESIDLASASKLDGKKVMVFVGR